jgi:hypothetical protein
MIPGEPGRGATQSLAASAGKAAERWHSRTLAPGAFEQCRLVLRKAIGFPDLEGGAEPDKRRALGDVGVRRELFGQHDSALRIKRQPL